MMKHWIGVALLGCALAAHAQTASPTKKELVAKVVQLQQPAVEAMARNVVHQSVRPLMADAARALQTQVAADKRETVGKGIEADIKQFVSEAEPIVRERAVALAPGAFGPVLEDRFSESELKELVAWLESPVSKKFAEVAPEIQNSFMRQVLTESAPLVDPKLKVLVEKTRKALGVPEAGAARKAPAPARAASR